MSPIRIAEKHTFLAFLLFLLLSFLTQNAKADSLSYSISGTLGDGGAAIEITSDANPGLWTIWSENVAGRISLGYHWVHLYYRFSPLLADFIHGKGSLRCITRMGLSPLVGVSLVLSSVNLGKRWPLLITIGVIMSVLLYMEILVRRHRGLRTKPAHPRKSASFSRTLRSGATELLRNPQNG